MDHDVTRTLPYKKACLSWTANNTRMSWLVSNDDDVNSRSIPSSSLLQASPDPIKLLAQKLFTEEHVRLENQQSGGRNSCGRETPASSALQTNWLRRTGWETTFRKARCDVLVRLTALPHCTDNRPLPLGVVKGDAIISPARNKRRLLFIIAALDRLLDQCGETVRTTDVCLRRWLRGRFPDRPYKMPFELVAKSSSEKVYRKELKRFVCFWLRLFRLLPTTFQKVTGHKLKKHQFRVLRELWVDDIWKSGEHVDVDPAADRDGGYDGDEGEYEYQDNDEDEDEIQDDDEGEDDEDDDGGEDDERYNEIEDESQESVVVNTGDPSDAEVMSTWSSNSQENHPQDPALDILLRFCYSAVTEDFDGGVASSTMLVYFSAVRGLTTPEGDEYLKPHRFTPILAKLIYCSRLIFLEAVLPRFSHNYGGLTHPPGHGLLRRFNSTRREYMCDGTLSPMGEFLSLLSYGNDLRRSQGSSFRFHWSDDGEVLSWDGNQRLSMVDFRGLTREVLRSATASCSRLMAKTTVPGISKLLERTWRPTMII
uniref:Uncharacterized protein n=1 Tax=Fusarium oxysporum (strain Fo5176) TaxID=660025 RepID=A0A0C4DIR1_FUSOF